MDLRVGDRVRVADWHRLARAAGVVVDIGEHPLGSYTHTIHVRFDRRCDGALYGDEFGSHLWLEPDEVVFLGRPAVTMDCDAASTVAY